MSRNEEINQFGFENDEGLARGRRKEKCRKILTSDQLRRYERRKRSTREEGKEVDSNGASESNRLTLMTFEALCEIKEERESQRSEGGFGSNEMPARK